MATRYLRTDLERIRKIYNDARTEYTDLQDKIDELNKQMHACSNDPALTQKGKNDARVQYSEEINKARAELDALIKKTSQSFSEARSDVDRFFGDLYRATPDKLDTNALELLKSGILTDTELSEMAEKYADNATMRRMIGKYAQERADKDRHNDHMRRLAQALNRKELPHLEAADALIFWSGQGLRTERSVSDGAAKHYNEQADRIIAQYGNISVKL